MNKRKIQYHKTVGCCKDHLIPTWRALAELTSKGKCDNQLCGMRIALHYKKGFEKKFNNVVRCGICNTVIKEDENWTETDCVICEACNERCKEEPTEDRGFEE